MKIQKYGDAYHSQNKERQTGATNKILSDVSSNKSLISDYEHDNNLHIPNTKSEKWYNSSYFLCNNWCNPDPPFPLCPSHTEG